MRYSARSVSDKERKMSMREEVKEAVRKSFATWASFHGPTAAACQYAIDRFFKDYEEVEVQECRDGPRTHWLKMPDCKLCEDGFVVGTRTILTRKPEPEQVTLSRETVARLAEHYEDTPGKTPGGDVALAEAKKVL